MKLDIISAPQVILIWLLTVVSGYVYGHQTPGEATYLGNEALMVSLGKQKILFDPFFHNSFGIYQKVPDSTRSKIFDSGKPFEGIDGIFISHAHQDHFSASDVLQYLQGYQKTLLFAPKEAVVEITKLDKTSTVSARLKSIDLKLGDQPYKFAVKNLEVEAVRIPHAGWPNRHKEVSNLVYRITLQKQLTIIHMGDADPNKKHFLPHSQHWNRRTTHTAFPPYWFFLAKSGSEILNKTINAKKHIGIHVPVTVPIDLIQSKADYFSKPGQKRMIIGK